MALTPQKKENIEWGFNFALNVLTLFIKPLVEMIKRRRAERAEKKKLQEMENKKKK